MWETHWAYSASERERMVQRFSREGRGEYCDGNQSTLLVAHETRLSRGRRLAAAAMARRGA